MKSINDKIFEAFSRGECVTVYYMDAFSRPSDKTYFSWTEYTLKSPMNISGFKTSSKIIYGLRKVVEYHELKRNNIIDKLDHREMSSAVKEAIAFIEAKQDHERGL